MMKCHNPTDILLKNMLCNVNPVMALDERSGDQQSYYISSETMIVCTEFHGKP